MHYLFMSLAVAGGIAVFYAAVIVIVGLVALITWR
jgi:hypothetical protein